MDDFETALKEFIEDWQGMEDDVEIAAALRAAADELEKPNAP